MIASFMLSFRSEDLSGKPQLLLRYEGLIKLFHIGIVHIIAFRSLIDTGYSLKVARNKFPAEKERIIRALWQIVVSYPELPGIIESALAVEADVPLEQNRTVSEGLRLLQGLIQDSFSVALALQLRSNADRTHGKNGNIVAVICIDDSFHEHVLPYQPSVLLHDEVQFLNECRVIAEHMNDIVLAAPRPVHIPEGLPDQVLNCPVILRFLVSNREFFH